MAPLPVSNPPQELSALQGLGFNKAVFARVGLNYFTEEGVGSRDGSIAGSGKGEREVIASAFFSPALQ